MSLGWVKRTPPGFEFAVKLYQKFTHPKLDARHRPPVSDGRRRRVQGAASSRSPPANGSGRCSRSFRPASRTRPRRASTSSGCCATFRDYPVAVELRHKSWSDESADVFDLLHEHGAAWTQIDEPKFRFSIRQDLMPNVKTFYYMRLHGRNAEQWWEHEQSEDRYNYLYSEARAEAVCRHASRPRARW